MPVIYVTRSFRYFYFVLYWCPSTRHGLAEILYTIAASGYREFCLIGSFDEKNPLIGNIEEKSV